MIKRLSFLKVCALALVSISPVMGQPVNIDTLRNTVPGARSVGDSAWFYAEQLGLFYANQASFPWLYVEGQDWWYTTESGWWYAASVVAGEPAQDRITLTLEEVEEIRTVIDAALVEYEIPGISYAIKFAGQPAFTDARGVSDLDENTILQASDVFRIGSASKSFTGVAILQLLDQGLIGLDMPINTYLPTGLLENYDGDSITVRMLLQHTSGIASYTNVIDEWNIPYIFDRTRVWTNEELVELMDGLFNSSTPGYGKTFDPGLTWSYSNTNTVLLGIIVEQVTGDTIHGYINEKVIDVVGLEYTYYPPPGESVMRFANTKGYMDWQNFTGADFVPAGLTDVTIYDPSAVGPAGPIVSNVEDLAIWIETLAFNSSLMSSSWQSLHTNTNGFIQTSATIPSVKYGLQLVHELDQQNFSNFPNIAHRGQLSGYDTVMIHLNEVNCSIAMMCNRTLAVTSEGAISGLEVAVYDMFEILFPDMVEKYAYDDPAESTETESLGQVKARAPRTTESKQVGTFFTLPLSEY